MQLIKIEKAKLLAIVKENREQHKKIFDEAIVGYKDKVIEVLEASLKRAQAGERIKVNIHLAEPINQTRDYDRVIRILELDTRDIIDLSESDFAQYVMDDWGWKHQFLIGNSAYSGTAAAFVAQGL